MLKKILFLFSFYHFTYDEIILNLHILTFPTLDNTVKSHVLTMKYFDTRKNQHSLNKPLIKVILSDCSFQTWR